MKLLNGKDLLTMFIKGQDLSKIYVANLEDNDREFYYLSPCNRNLLLVDVYKPNIVILDTSEDVTPSTIADQNSKSIAMLSQPALSFLQSCNYTYKSHTERQALIMLAKTLYPAKDEDGE